MRNNTELMAKLAKFFPLYLLFYFILILVNATMLPVAWVDEVMLIDPALNLINNGHFASKIWPFINTEVFFAAYLPVPAFLYAFALGIFSNTIFVTRITWIILFAIHIYLLYRLLSHYLKNKEIVYFLLFVYLNLEGITNAMRSGRAEIPELLFISLFLFAFLIKKNPIISGLSLTFLGLCHPSMWMICLIAFIWIVFGKFFKPFKIKFLISAGIPVILFILFAGENLIEYQNQLFVHAAEHSNTQNQHNFLTSYFVDFFLPVYASQPYLILFIWLAFGYSCYKIFNYKKNRDIFIPLLFIGTYIFWMFSLAVFHRYTPVIVFLSFLLIPSMMDLINNNYPNFKLKFKSTLVTNMLFLIALLLVSAPFLIRNSVAIVQKQQRSTKPLFAWLDKEIKTDHKKILIVGAPVGLFYSMKNENVEYTLTYGTRKFKFNDYEKVYYLKHRHDRICGKFIANYPISESDFEATLSKLFKTETYLGMSLYQISSEQELQDLNYYFD